jgi:pimeloyl-ACP methyl ester carboxylesterase
METTTTPRSDQVPVQYAHTSSLAVAYEEHGPADGRVVILLHGFPYDPRCFDAVASPLAALGYRVIVPYLRGFGPTRFLSPDAIRSGQQAALGYDLLGLLDALGISRAALVGYDWGGRAACIAAALWPERVACLVTGAGYNIQDIPGAVAPQPPEREHRLWYQYYFNTQRGRDGLAANRGELARLLWRLWSPNWQFDDATFARTSASFDNPDFVDVVIHSYRHRFGYVPGDPVLEDTERVLARQPRITVPAISLCGAGNGVSPTDPVDRDVARFSAKYERRVLPGIGHNIPQEAPEATIAALLDLLR